MHLCNSASTEYLFSLSKVEIHCIPTPLSNVQHIGKQELRSTVRIYYLYENEMNREESRIWVRPMNDA